MSRRKKSARVSLYERFLPRAVVQFLQGASPQWSLITNHCYSSTLCNFRRLTLKDDERCKGLLHPFRIPLQKCSGEKTEQQIHRTWPNVSAGKIAIRGNYGRCASPKRGILMHFVLQVSPTTLAEVRCWWREHSNFHGIELLRWCKVDISTSKTRWCPSLNDAQVFLQFFFTHVGDFDHHRLAMASLWLASKALRVDSLDCFGSFLPDAPQSGKGNLLPPSRHCQWLWGLELVTPMRVK